MGKGDAASPGWERDFCRDRWVPAWQQRQSGWAMLEDAAAGGYLATGAFHGQLAESSAAGDILPLALSLPGPAGGGHHHLARGFQGKNAF